MGPIVGVLVAAITFSMEICGSTAVDQADDSSGLFIEPDNTTGGYYFTEDSSGSGYQDQAADGGLFAEDYKYVYTDNEGNGNRNPCVFPFKYKNKMYHRCTKIDCIHGKYWCATTSDYDKDKLWGHCLTEKEMSSCPNKKELNGAKLECDQWATMGECLINPLYADSNCPRSCGLCTYLGNAKGKPCKFPYIYENEVHFKCLPYQNGFWCSTTDNYDVDKEWGYCYPQRFTGILQIIRRFLAYGECDDQDKDCPNRARNGECKTNAVWMVKNCPWSCHLCAPIKLLNSTAVCKDYHQICGEWSMRGDCLAKPVFMYAICRASCRLCEYKNVKESLVFGDKDKSCPEWASRGDCETNQDYMLQNCRNSCRAGGVVNGAVCMDKYAHCRVWAKEGYCRTNGAYLAEICPFSCNMCPLGTNSQL